MRGKFFTYMWGGTTSDLDVQSLIHGYSLSVYDIDKTAFRFDKSVVQDMLAIKNENGDKVYQIVLCDDMKYSDGTPITAWDYAYTVLFTMNPVIAETGGVPMDYSWIDGAEDYVEGKSAYVSGLRVVNDQILKITAKKESLPYFYELGRFRILPYPSERITPGITVKDDGNGAYLSGKITKRTLESSVLDNKTGYLTHPDIVSGPYTLTGFDGVTARFEVNPYYKGTENGFTPQIKKIEYTLAKNKDMVGKLENGDFNLINKATKKTAIDEGKNAKEALNIAYSRVGLTMIWFNEDSPRVQEQAVRKAIAYCFDRKGFTSEYTGHYGEPVDGFYGIGQWMYLLAAQKIAIPMPSGMTEEEQQKEKETYQENGINQLRKYEFNTSKAVNMLENSGWLVNRDNVREKTIKDNPVTLELTLGIPDSGDEENVEKIIKEKFTDHLEKAGIRIKTIKMSMEELQKAYRGETSAVDMIYIGEDFTVYLKPEVLKPYKSVSKETKITESLSAVKEELYELVLHMQKTSPSDYKGFYMKWIRFQKELTETLPLIPVYSNEYYDFFTQRLHNYRIKDAVTWGDAIIESYIH